MVRPGRPGQAARADPGKLNAAVQKVSAEADVKARLEALGASPAANTSAEFGAQIAAEIAKNKRIAKEANVKID